MRRKKEIVLELKGVWKIYGEGDASTTALEDVNMYVKKGEFLSIVGPSGSGKSTLLHMLGLLDEPTKGKVFIDNIDTSKLSDDEKATFRGSKIGFVFQTFNLLPLYTALENVTLPLLIHNVDEETAKEKAREYLELVGLGHRLEHKPSQLSGGQRQRVAIARALVMEPTYILADEPTGNLDTKTGDEIIELFKKLNREGQTIVMVTHNPLTTKYSDRVIHIRDGKILKEEVKR